MTFKSFLILFFTLLSATCIFSQDTLVTTTTKKRMVKDQDDAGFYRDAISFRALLLDYQSQNGGSLGNLSGYHYGVDFGYFRNLTNRISVGLPIKIGVVNYDTLTSDFDNNLHKMLIGVDLVGQYHFLPMGSNFLPYVTLGYGYVYERVGHELEAVSNLQASGGLGLKIRLEDRAYLQWESQYRYSLSDNRNNLQHGLGFYYNLGPRKMKKVERDLSELDSDGDTIIDELDLCPQTAGLPDLQGCPDTDGDGLADYLDKCPDLPGLRSMNGCPDSDGDGVSDILDECPNLAGAKANRGCPANDSDNDGIPNNLDKCPTVAGTAANNGCPEIDTDNDGIPDNLDRCPNIKGDRSGNGCPDKDGDGVIDSDDRCPSTAGTAANNGCPRRTTVVNPPVTNSSVDTDGDGVPDNVDRCPNRAGLHSFAGCPDSDNDGIDDSRDRCPNMKGTIDNSGCPRIAQRDLEFLEIAMRSIQFETGVAELKVESYRILRQIAEIMNRYPDYNLSISGHTDNVGGASTNQILSENRARACYQFLINAGINAARMNYAGYGESRPISDNNTSSGRTLNRRVEFTLLPR